jgi:hypothetical protein
LPKSFLLQGLLRDGRQDDVNLSRGSLLRIETTLKRHVFSASAAGSDGTHRVPDLVMLSQFAVKMVYAYSFLSPDNYSPVRDLFVRFRGWFVTAALCEEWRTLLADIFANSSSSRTPSEATATSLKGLEEVALFFTNAGPVPWEKVFDATMCSAMFTALFGVPPPVRNAILSIVTIVVQSRPAAASPSPDMPCLGAHMLWLVSHPDFETSLTAVEVESWKELHRTGLPRFAPEPRCKRCRRVGAFPLPDDPSGSATTFVDRGSV